MKKIFILFAFLFILLPLNCFSLQYPELNSKSVMVYDRTDDKILYSYNNEEKKSIASLTKIVTTIVSIEKIDNLDEQITIDYNIISSVDPVASKAGLKIGDVVTYTSDNGFITHRIIKKEGNKVTTKGDANNTEDDTINVERIIGKVIISGGLLNIVIKYKFVLVAFFLSLYLFSCYFGDNEEDNNGDNGSQEEATA